MASLSNSGSSLSPFSSYNSLEQARLNTFLNDMLQIDGNLTDIDDEMASKEKRLETYKKWTSSPVDPEVLANAGFYYTGFRDQVRCFSCDLQLEQWTSEDDPFEEHKKWKNDCNFLREYQRHMTQQTDPTTVQRQHGRNLFNQQSFNRNPHYGVEEQGTPPWQGVTCQSNGPVLKTPDHFTANKPQFQVNNSILPTSEDKCQGRSSLHSQSDPTAMFHRQSSMPMNLPHHISTPSSISCPPAASSGQYGSHYQQMSGFDDNKPLLTPQNVSIPVMHPVNQHVPEFHVRTEDTHHTSSQNDLQSLHHRLATFIDWPENCPVRPWDLADAGFSYMGAGDSVKCYKCKVSLRNWEPDDTPWSEHYRWSPECPLVQNHKEHSRTYDQKQPREESSCQSPFVISSPGQKADYTTNRESIFSPLQASELSYTTNTAPAGFPGFNATKPQLHPSMKNTVSQAGFFIGPGQPTNTNTAFSTNPEVHSSNQPWSTTYPCWYSTNTMGFTTSSVGYNSNTTGFSTIQTSPSSSEQGSTTNPCGYSINSTGYTTNSLGYSINPTGFSMNADESSNNLQYSPKVTGSSHSTVGSSSYLPGYMFSPTGSTAMNAEGSTTNTTVTATCCTTNATVNATCHTTNTTVTATCYTTNATVPPLNKEPSSTGAAVSKSATSLDESDINRVIEMGFSNEDINNAVARQQEKTGQGFSNLNDLMHALLDENPTSCSPTPPLQVQIPTQCQASLKPMPLSASENLSFDQSNFFSPKRGLKRSNSAPASSNNVKTNQAVKQMDSLQEERLICKICMDAEVGVVFIPCGHISCCPECAYGLDLCPMCRVPIQQTIRTFLS